MSAPFTPILYLKAGCPHCFKVRLFLLEAGLADRFEQREFTPGDDLETMIRDELAAYFEKMTFPAVQVSPGLYMNESEAIIAHYAAEFDIDTSALPLLRTFSDIILPKQQKLRSENKTLLARLEAANA